jgi:hypothetical protein
MAIHHRSLVDVRPYVDKHGRHTDHPRRQVNAVSNARSARHDVNFTRQSNLPDRIGVLVEKPPQCI